MGKPTYTQAVKEWMENLEDPHICCDLDGTLAKYDQWRGELHIGDPIPAMVKKVKAALAKGLKVKIFTARVAEEEWVLLGASIDTQTGPVAKLIRAWTQKHIGVALEVTATKNYNTIEIWDDRARQVVPNKGTFTSPKRKKTK